jgi:hypothetical protein
MVNSYYPPAKELLVAGPVTTIIRWVRTVTDVIYIHKELIQVTCMFLLYAILLIIDSILFLPCKAESEKIIYHT